MALIDVECTDDACGHVAENIYRRAAEWETTPPCEKCNQPTVRVFLPPRTTWRADPVVVFQAADGTYRFPGDANGLSAAQYAKQGLTRIELRGAADVRRFEKQWNTQERSRMAGHVEARHRGRTLQEGEGRSHLHARMKSFSNMGKDVARASMAIGNARPQPQTSDPGCHVEVYSHDRSNREASRGADGRRRRD